MQRDTALIWSWLNVLTSKRYKALVEAYGNLDAALAALSEPVLKGLGCRDDTVMKTLNRYEEFDVAAYEKVLEKRELQLITIEEDAYPKRLREIPDAPVFLYAKGDLEILDQPCIALVGTREMSSYGKRVTEAMAGDLVRAGIVTVSGLAAGIDAECARSTLATGGKTVAVLGHGLGSIHPVGNARLAEEIVAKGGLLLSEYPLDTVPDIYTFPARNRIIAGLSLGTVVIEAGEGSGALITADLALDYGREVFAVPGQVFDEHYAGCHRLLAQGHAQLVTSAADVLKVFNIGAPVASSSAYAPVDEKESTVYKALTSMPQSVTDLVERSGLKAGDLNAALTMMELAGGARNVGNGMWVRS